jgi:hypothetical protein
MPIVNSAFSPNNNNIEVRMYAHWISSPHIMQQKVQYCPFINTGVRSCMLACISSLRILARPSPWGVQAFKLVPLLSWVRVTLLNIKTHKQPRPRLQMLTVVHSRRRNLKHLQSILQKAGFTILTT